MDEGRTPRNLLLIGAGGIGTQLTELLVAALRRVNLSGSITLMDADVVEAGNLGHQRYTEEDDIGQAKVACLAKRLDDVTSSLRVQGKVENLREAEQLKGADLVIVCVDRPEPRRLVHGLDVPWVDVRCSGDGWLMLSSETSPALLERMTPDHEPMSCQVEGALEAGNLNSVLQQPLHMALNGPSNNGVENPSRSIHKAASPTAYFRSRRWAHERASRCRATQTRRRHVERACLAAQDHRVDDKDLLNAQRARQGWTMGRCVRPLGHGRARNLRAH